MKYCLRSRLSTQDLRKADEIRVDFRDKESIPDLLQKFSDKPIILFPPVPYENDVYDWNQMSIFSNLGKENFIINCGNLDDAFKAIERHIPFMLGMEATSYWDLKSMVDLGAKYAYIGIPLFFNLEHVKKFDIKIRAIPTVAYTHILPHSSGVYGKWIRPEDVELYEDYIDVLEFEPCDVTREHTLFDIYANRKEWSTRLDLLVTDLGSSAINRMIPPEVAQTRISCHQRCQANSTCHICQTYLDLANPEVLNKVIRRD